MWPKLLLQWNGVKNNIQKGCQILDPPQKEKDYETPSPIYGFPQTLQTPFSLMVPMQLPSRQGIRSEESVSAFSITVGFPQRQQ